MSELGLHWYGPQSIESTSYLWRWSLRAFKVKILEVPPHELMLVLNLIFDRFTAIACNLKKNQDPNRTWLSKHTFINAFYCSYFGTRSKFIFPKHMPEEMWRCMITAHRYIKILHDAQEFVTLAAKEDTVENYSPPLDSKDHRQYLYQLGIDIEKTIQPMMRRTFPKRICTIKDYEFAVGIANLEVLVQGVFWWLLVKDTTHICDWGREFSYFDILNRDFDLTLQEPEDILALINKLKHNEHLWARTIHSFVFLPIVKTIQMNFN